MSNSKLNVYLATLPRSGSTMLGMMLNAHSEIFHIGESSYWGKLNPEHVRCSCGNVGCDVLLSVYKMIQLSDDVSSIYETCQLIDRIEEPEKVYHGLSLPSGSGVNYDVSSLNDLIRKSCIGLEELTDSFRSVVGKSTVIDNTKSIYIGESISKKKDWKVILLTRDPRGLAYSNKKAGERKNVTRPIDHKIPVYINFFKKALCLIGSPNVLHVKYEYLCADTEKTLIEISKFLGISFEPEMLNFKEDKGHTIMGNRMRFDDNNTVKEDLDWIQGLIDEDMSVLRSNKELVSLLRYFGYFII